MIEMLQCGGLKNYESIEEPSEIKGGKEMILSDTLETAQTIGLLNRAY